MEIYVVRHGRTNNNDLRIYNGSRSDEDLNDTGVAQARQTRETLLGIPLDLIVCSPMTRTRHTAAILNEGRSLPVVYDERLIERDQGDLTLKPFLGRDGLRALGDRLYTEYHVETEQSIRARVAEALEDLKEKYPGKTVLIVTHGGTTKAVQAYCEGRDYPSCTIQDNCEVRKYTL